MNLSAGVTAFLVFCAVVFGTFAIVLTWEVLRDWMRRREVARRLRPMLGTSDGTQDLQSHDLIRQFEATESFLSALTDSLPGVDRTRRLLIEARSAWSVESFFLLSVGLGFGLGAATLVLTGVMPASVIAAAIGVAIPYFMVLRQRDGRVSRFEEEFPESIDLLTRAIRAGHPLSSGMRMVAEEGPPTVAEEFRKSFEEQRFGLPFQDALLGMVDRTNLVDVRIFAIAVLIQREVGGNLAEILENLADTIRGRFYIRRQLRVYTAQGRLSGYALAALPVVVGLLFFLIQPEHIGLLFTTTIGWFMVGVAVVLQVLGVLWIRSIINIEI
jgi:tight adherence protein B